MRQEAQVDVPVGLDLKSIDFQRILEACMHERKERLQTFMEHSPALAFMKDAEGHYIYMNSRCEHALNIVFSDLQGATDFDLFPYQEALQIRESDQSVLSSGQSLDFLELLPTRDGTPRYWSGHKFPFVDISGQKYVGGIGIDVSEHLETAEALREETARLSAVITTQQEIATTPRALDAVMHIVVQRAQNITGADGAAVELVEADKMVYKAVSGLATPFLDLRLDINASLSGTCIRENCVLRCDDSETDGRVDRDACRRIGIRSMVVVPLLHQHRTVGVLKVMGIQPNTFHERDVATLQLMAGMVAAAMSDALALEAKQALLEARLQAAAAVQETEERFRAAIDAGLDAIFILRSVRDAQGKITDFTFLDLNARAQKMIGKPRAEILERSLSELFPVDLLQPFFETYVRVVETRETIEEDRQVTAAHISASWLHHQNVPLGDGVVVTCRDITERKEFERQLAEANAKFALLAAEDGLTGLKNRRALQEFLDHEYARLSRYHNNEPISILILDIDHFKSYNDTFGHLEGDKVLVQMAQVLENCSRSADLVARYGGEEFVVVMPNTGKTEAIRVGERIQAAVDTVVWPNRKITVSMGVSTSGAASPETELLAQADNALYASKRMGRNRITHFENAE